MVVYNIYKMNDEAFSDEAIKNACKERFGLNIDVAEVVARNFPVSSSSRAALFKAKNGQVLLYIKSRGAQVFGDVQKMVLRMECEADYYYPPHGEPEYFDRVARDKFKVLFPGKHILGEDDLRYYKALAPYSPALVRIAKVKGEVRAYDEQLKAWRKIKDFHYSKIVTS